MKKIEFKEKRMLPMQIKIKKLKYNIPIEVGTASNLSTCHFVQSGMQTFNFINNITHTASH